MRRRVSRGARRTPRQGAVVTTKAKASRLSLVAETARGRPHHLSSPLRPQRLMPMLVIKQLAVLKKCKQDPQESIRYAAQRTGMTVSSRPKGQIVGAGARVALHPDACPMECGRTQASITRVAHHDRAAPSTLFGHGCHPHVSAQDMVGSLLQGLRSLSEHRGGDATPD